MPTSRPPRRAPERYERAVPVALALLAVLLLFVLIAIIAVVLNQL
jgi:hypothetical protein